MTPRPGVHRSLWPLLTAYGISQYGNWLFRAGVIYEAYNRAHGSAAVLTAAVLLVYIPVLLGSWFLAPLVDRWNTRVALVTLDLVRAAMLLGLFAVVLLRQELTSGFALAALAILSLLSPLFTAAQTAHLRRVLAPEHLAGALAWVSKMDWGTFILGTAAGPILLQITNVPQLIAVDVISFLASAALLSNLAPSPALVVSATGTVRSVRRPIGRTTLQLLACIALLNAGAGLINVYPNVVTRDFQHAGAGRLGLINLLDGIGGLVGATVVGRLRAGDRRRPIILGAAAISLCLLIMAGASHLSLVLVGSAGMLLAGQIFAVSAQTRMLADEPAQSAGRISGYFTLATFAGVTVSTLLFPAVSAWGTIQSTFGWLLVLGAVLVAVASLGISFIRFPSIAAPDVDSVATADAPVVPAS